MPARDVVVTGAGLVTPLGCTAAETAQAWQSGASAEFLTEPLLAGTPLEDVRVARREKRRCGRCCPSGHACCSEAAESQLAIVNKTWELAGREQSSRHRRRPH